MNITQLQPLIPFETITPSQNLLDSISRYGVLSPVMVVGDVICDGHRRVAACLKLGINEIPVLKINGNPVELFFELNNREFDVNQVSLLTSGLSDKEISLICDKVGFSDSPQMVAAIKYLSQLLKNKPELLDYQLPANIWRELGHLGDSISLYAEDLMRLPGTVGEKRNIAAFLRQAKRRNELPTSIKADNASKLLPILQKTAQPRRTEAFEKYEKALSDVDFPSGVSIKIDPTFAQPGVSITANIKRNELDKLEKTVNSLESLFKAVPEL